MSKIKNFITKENLFNISIVLIIIALYIFDVMFLYTTFRERKRNEITNEIIEEIDEQVSRHEEPITSINSDESSIEMKYEDQNYTIIGKIKIDKINIYQPIIKENTKDSYNVSAVKMSGPSLNTYGNVAIGGHNFMKGNFFIKLNKLVKNDIVEITDLTGTTIKYYVYEYGVTSIDDASYLRQPDDETIKMITLVTCTKGGKERYYVKAKAK